MRSNWNLALALAIGGSGLAGSAVAGAAPDAPRVIGISGPGLVTADWGGKATRIETGQPVGPWTLMAVVRGGMPDGRLAVFEDFSQTNGHLLFVDAKGVKLDLPKSSEQLAWRRRCPRRPALKFHLRQGTVST